MIKNVIIFILVVIIGWLIQQWNNTHQNMLVGYKETFFFRKCLEKNKIDLQTCDGFKPTSRPL